MSGKPRALYVDNAAEFKSEALRRGCDQHGIELAYRPPGLPHFGGIVERLIGTMMGMVHELPGTTFSNTAERGDYDSDTKAALTLRELQRWMALAVACYLGQIAVAAKSNEIPAVRKLLRALAMTGPDGDPGRHAHPARHRQADLRDPRIALSARGEGEPARSPGPHQSDAMVQARAQGQTRAAGRRQLHSPEVGR